MLRIQDHPLPAAAQTKLVEYQQEVNAEPTFPKQVEAATKKFSSRNTRQNATFVAVRQTLSNMCAGVRRCMYCEDSMADEVEHHRPKDIYPEQVFTWVNYLYACGPCNGPKNNKFFVIRDGDGELVDVRPIRGASPSRPATGSYAIIDPRAENPMDLLSLDFQTGRFVPRYPETTVEGKKAKTTLEILTLNERNDVLNEARKDAYNGFFLKLEAYVGRKQRQESAARLEAVKKAILRSPHPTVWEEMKRRHDKVDELRDLFAEAPEALGWSIVE